MPPLQAANCPAIDPGVAQRVNDALLDGPGGVELTVLVASTGVDGPTEYIVGSIYDSSGFRVSTADVWAVVDGALLAVSAGANQYSDGLPDAGSVLTGPPSPVQLDLVACVTAALG